MFIPCPAGRLFPDESGTACATHESSFPLSTMSLRGILKFTAIGRILVIPYRVFAVALPYLARQVGLMLRWTFASKEHYNHTYHLTDLSRHYLDSYVSVIS